MFVTEVFPGRSDIVGPDFDTTIIDSFELERTEVETGVEPELSEASMKVSSFLI
jgi:hypothetical protein